MTLCNTISEKNEVGRSASSSAQLSLAQLVSTHSPVGSQGLSPHDASLQGWGAHCEQGEASGLWDRQMSAMHINWLELYAIALSLQHFCDFLRSKCVVVCSDNTTALAYIRSQGGTASPSLSRLAEQIWSWAHSQGMTLLPEFIPGKLNVLADSLSRSSTPLPTEWTIAHSALLPLWELWGKPLVDLFATRYSARLPIYISPIRDPLALARNAFTIPWSGLVAYAYPPSALISKTLEKYLLDRPRLILVTPG